MARITTCSCRCREIAKTPLVYNFNYDLIDNWKERGERFRELSDSSNSFHWKNLRSLENVEAAVAFMYPAYYQPFNMLAWNSEKPLTAPLLQLFLSLDDQTFGRIAPRTAKDTISDISKLFDQVIHSSDPETADILFKILDRLSASDISPLGFAYNILRVDTISNSAIYYRGLAFFFRRLVAEQKALIRSVRVISLLEHVNNLPLPGDADLVREFARTTTGVLKLYAKDKPYLLNTVNALNAKFSSRGDLEGVCIRFAS